MCCVRKKAVMEWAGMLLIPVLLSFSMAFAEQAPPPQGQETRQDQVEAAVPTKSDAETETQDRAAIPGKSCISGVPFMSWREAAQIDYLQKEIVNPSMPAACGMMWEFWGRDRKAPLSGDKKADEGLKVLGGNKENRPWSVEDLKACLARGIPVVVALPLTPEAHPLYFTFEIMIKYGGIKNVQLIDEGRPRSNALGRMMSLEDLLKIKGQGGMNPIMESVLIARKLVIGYDDERKVLILHDPSFGPALEIGYSDFERMWEAADRNYMAVIPEGHQEKMATGPSVPDYRARTPEEQAAMHFVYGYALDCLGRLEEGSRHFEEGLRIEGISPEYRYLLLFELALNRGERSDWAGAIEAAELATASLPEHPGAWAFLADLYKIYPEGGDRKKAKNAAKKAKSLEKDQKAQETVAMVLPADFFIQYLGGVRGWGGQNPAK